MKCCARLLAWVSVFNSAEEQRLPVLKTDIQTTEPHYVLWNSNFLRFWSHG